MIQQLKTCYYIDEKAYSHLEQGMDGSPWFRRAEMNSALANSLVKLFLEECTQMSEIRYPVEAMHTTAKHMRDNAYSALSQHDTTWRFIRYCIYPLPGFIQSILNNVLDPYDYRLRQSYQLQIDFANWLDYAATSMNGINQDVAHVFQNMSQLF